MRGYKGDLFTDKDGIIVQIVLVYDYEGMVYYRCKRNMPISSMNDIYELKSDEIDSVLTLAPNATWVEAKWAY